MLTNAFSLNMLTQDFAGGVMVSPATADDARAALATGGSAIGHEDTAAVLSQMLGVVVPAERRTVTLWDRSEFVVAQYRGPRLPEGATILPEGATMSFIKVKIDGFAEPSF